MPKQKTKKKSVWEQKGYSVYTYLDADGKVNKFLAKDDSDADLYKNKVNATS